MSYFQQKYKLLIIYRVSKQKLSVIV